MATQFKDIKQNYPVFILDKNELIIKQGKVVNVSFPHIDTNMPTYKPGAAQMVVDVTIEADGKSATYTMPESSYITYANNLVLSTDKSSLSNEVEAMKNSAEQVLESVEHNKMIVEKATSLLAELNPAYKEKQETEKRLSNVENSVSEIKNMLSEFIKKMS